MECLGWEGTSEDHLGHPPGKTGDVESFHERPSTSLSPAVNLTLPSPPRKHVTEYIKIYEILLGKVDKVWFACGFKKRVKLSFTERPK